MEAFKKLGLSDELARAIHEAHITEPREIQEKAIPLALAGKDIIGESATGSGKTLAFGAGIIEKAEKGKGIQALILVPTRELAEQVSKSLILFSKHKHLSILSIYGGVSIEPQIRQAQRADIVVGTPGRVLDHLERRTLDLRNIKTAVLDEADRMLDMGFIDDVQKILERCPNEKQTLLFSATISPDIEHIAKKYLKHPVIVSAEVYVDPSKLKQIYYDTPRNLKFSILVHLLKNEQAGLVMVFCNTRRNTDFVAANLSRYGIDAMAIHGGLAQNKRNKILERFNSSKVFVLVCTDVAARGLDIKNVSHVYNYDIPKTSTEYVHRIGRTARAGKEGIAISIVADRDYDNFRHVLRDDSLKIEKVEVPQVEEIRVNFSGGDRESSGRGFSRGGGRSFGGGGRRFSGGGGGRGYGGGRSFGGGSRRGFGGHRSRDSGDSDSGDRRDRRPSGGHRGGYHGRSGGHSSGSRSFGRSRRY